MKDRIIDLTLPYKSGSPGFEKSSSKTVSKDGWNASTLTFYSHSGTHMDAPIHFEVSDETIDQIPLDRFVGRAWKIAVPATSDHLLITPEMIMDQLVDFEEGDSLLLHTGWSGRVGTPDYRDKLPRVSEALAEWCVSNKVKMLGVEPPSVADVNNLEEVTRIHRILLGNVVIIEGLTNLDQIREKQVKLIALPLKIAGGDGAPARVIAMESLE
ncbi:MAG: cyclase family protein [Bacteroidota bacterium]